jgi:hypothetical protein
MAKVSGQIVIVPTATTGIDLSQLLRPDDLRVSLTMQAEETGQ